MKQDRSALGAVTVRGLVETLFYSGARFSAGRLRLASGGTVPFAGHVFAQVNEPVVLRGRWGRHPKYGPQFEVEGMEFDFEIDPQGLANYLAHNPEFRGIGPAKAKLIAERFAADFDRVIVSDPARIAAAANLPLNVIVAVREKWVEGKNRNAAATILAAYGLTHHQLSSLIDEFGDRVVPMLKNDPYLLVSALPGFGFKRVDKVALQMGTPKDHPRRIRAGILYTVTDALEEGDCWVEYENLLDRANQLLIMDTLDSREVIERYLEQLIKAGDLACSPYERLVVAKPEIESMEQDLAAALSLASAPNPHFHDAAKFELLLPPELNWEQRQAVLTCLRFRISLISGGAGVGKTFTIRSIVDICRSRNLVVALAAPTGKAAKRMEQLVGRPASTLHRLLKFDGKSFAKGPDDPLEADLVIVDEVSMLDVRLAWQLFRAIDFTRTALLLVGDHNQLPPVGPGNPLRDLVRSDVVPATLLTKVMRQAGVLKENSLAILAGQVQPTSDDEVHGRRSWYVVDQFTDVAQVREFLLTLFSGVLAERLRFDVVRDVQVLTPTHKGPLGTRALNIDLQRLIQAKLYRVEVPDVPPNRLPPLLAHDKIIQTRNNYGLGLMNGALGQVREVGPQGELHVEFEGRLIEIPSSSPDRDDLRLAYAQSFHKMQGSEFPCAIVIAHRLHDFMHHRNLLYTGVTRAQQTAIILGDHWGIQHCVKKVQVDRRNTFLSFLLPALEHTPAAPTVEDFDPDLRSDTGPHPERHPNEAPTGTTEVSR